MCKIKIPNMVAMGYQSQLWPDGLRPRAAGEYMSLGLSGELASKCPAFWVQPRDWGLEALLGSFVSL